METLKDCATVYPIVKASLLNELRGGDLEGLTDDEIRSEHPEEFRQRVQEKHLYRYPGAGGESYFDVMQRLRPIIIEVERQRRSLLVVCHLAVQQCIYGYFVGGRPKLHNNHNTGAGRRAEVHLRILGRPYNVYNYKLRYLKSYKTKP
jgi:broad specificity phosphatase PhoE